MNTGATFRDELLNDTLEFWFPRSVDTEHGGFIHSLDRDGTIIERVVNNLREANVIEVIVVLGHESAVALPKWKFWQGDRGKTQP